MPSLSGNNNVTITITTEANTEGVTKAKQAVQQLTEDADEKTAALSAKTSALVGAVAGATQTLVNDGINAVTSSIGDAVKRVDTLNNSSKVFENLGFHTEDVKTAMDGLKTSILGLPTSLDQGVQGMESLALQSGNIKDAQKVFTAMNDAVLSSGHSTADLNNAINQLTQLDMNGPLDAQTWNSLKQSGLEPALKAMSNMATNGDMAKLKDEFGKGQLSVRDFTDMLKKLDTDGTGNMASLNKQAHDMTSGIGTGMANAKTAITRGLADIISSIGTTNISSTIAKIGKDFETVFKAIANNMGTIKVFAGILAPIVAGIVAVTAAIKVATAAQALWNIITEANPWVLLAMVVIGAIFLIATHWKEITALIQQGWSDIKQWCADAINFIKEHWQLILEIIGGPFIAAALLIATHWTQIKNGAWDVVSSIGNFFANLWGVISGGVDNAYHGLINWAKRTCDDIVSFFKDLPGRITGSIGNISSKVAGDIKGAFHSLHIPGFASGVHNFGGGLALVGESGPELAYLPPGSDVYSNTQSKQMIGSAGSSVNITIQNLSLPSVTDRASFIAALDQDSILAGRGLTTNRGLN